MDDISDEHARVQNLKYLDRVRSDSSRPLSSGVPFLCVGASSRIRKSAQVSLIHYVQLKTRLYVVSIDYSEKRRYVQFVH